MQKFQKYLIIGFDLRPSPPVLADPLCSLCADYYHGPQF